MKFLPVNLQRFLGILFLKKSEKKCKKSNFPSNLHKSDFLALFGPLKRGQKGLKIDFRRGLPWGRFFGLFSTFWSSFWGKSSKNRLHFFEKLLKNCDFLFLILSKKFSLFPDNSVPKMAFFIFFIFYRIFRFFVN